MQLKKIKPLILETTFVFLLSIALGHGGPYGTFDRFELLPRIVFWVLVIMLPWCVSKTLFFIAQRYAPESTPPTFLWVLLVPVLALMGSAAVTMINMEVGLYGDKPFLTIWPRSILTWLVFGFMLVLPLFLLAKGLVKEQRKTGVTTMMEFFHHKLPDSLKGGQLIALKAEDHYLRVFTDVGSALILMKFEDALAALNGYPGIQTHRSWWVASSQLEGKPVLLASDSCILLNDNTSVPVSRRKRKSVNEHIERLNPTKKIVL